MTKTTMTPEWLRRFTKLVAASTLFLIFAGAMVTSTGSGLAVPDWPLSYGMVFPPMVGGIFYEHGHRMIAATVGFLTIIQAIWLQRREPKAFVRRLGWVSLATVVAQGVLGGITVLFLLPTAVSVSHAGLAEIFLGINVAIAFFTSRFYGSHSQVPSSDGPGLAVPAMVVVILVYAQILAGAVMRHLSAGLAIPDFPLSLGRIVPAFTSTGVAVNYAHRVGALLVTIAIAALAPRVMRSAVYGVRALYVVLIALLSLQITLAAYTVWTAKNPTITSLHVVTGAAILACSIVFALANHMIERRVAVERFDRGATEVPA